MGGGPESGAPLAPVPAVPALPQPSEPSAPSNPVVRFGDVLRVLEKNGGALSLEGVPSLGLALIEPLRADTGLRLRGTSPDELLWSQAGGVRARA